MPHDELEFIFEQYPDQGWRAVYGVADLWDFAYGVSDLEHGTGDAPQLLANARSSLANARSSLAATARPSRRPLVSSPVTSISTLPYRRSA